MFKKILQVFLGLVFLFVVYLFFVNWLIYYRLGQAGLKASDNQHTYILNGQTFGQATNSAGLIYVALGDSLSAGVGVNDYKQSFPYLVAQKMALASDNKITHLNYSYPGARTSDLIADLLPLAIKDQPDVVTLLIGVNDIHGKVSSAKFKNHYDNILKQLKTQTTAKINVISLPLLGSDALLWPPFNYYYERQTLRFNEIIKDLARANNVNYIDLTGPSAEYAAANNSFYATDNFHPSNLGYDYWAQIIYEHLNK